MRPNRARILTAIGLATVCSALVPGIASATSGIQCDYGGTRFHQLGVTCIDVHGSGLQVTEVQSWFVPPDNSYLAGKTWAQELTTYKCNPLGKTKAKCPPNHSPWYSQASANRIRIGQVVCNPQGKGSSNFPGSQCDDFGVGVVAASAGDWLTFYALPHTFASATYMCSELAVRQPDGTWVDNGPPGSVGARACIKVG